MIAIATSRTKPTTMAMKNGFVPESPGRGAGVGLAAATVGGAVVAGGRDGVGLAVSVGLAVGEAVALGLADADALRDGDAAALVEGEETPVGTGDAAAPTVAQASVSGPAVAQSWRPPAGTHEEPSEATRESERRRNG